MKAIILETRDGYAAALREDGVVVKTRQLAPVGTTVELSEKTVAFPSRSRRFLRTAVAAALALAVTGGAYTYTNVAAASYVTLDTEETSVELAFNRMGRVVGVRALDEDSQELARALYDDVRRMNAEDAVDAVMERLDGAGAVVAGVMGENDRSTADLKEAIERGMERRERGDTECVTVEVSRAERREATERDVSAGRWVFERSGGRWNDEQSAFPPASDEAEPPAIPDGIEAISVPDEAEPPAAPDGTEQPSMPDEAEPPAAPNGTEPPAMTNGTEMPAAPNEMQPPSMSGGTELPPPPNGAEPPQR